jgi:5-methylcytosine rRNA methyltransferase NSUN4
MKRTGKAKSKPDFNEYYSDLFKESWTGLREALIKPSKHVLADDRLLLPYHIDEASLYAARCLEVVPGESVLDMCAAPGGKTLVFAMMLEGRGRLIANERSASRRDRLQKVLLNHLPSENHKIIKVTGHDATRWCQYEQSEYDKILLDVPCSSERHVIKSPAHLKRWSPARTKHLSFQAYAFLSSALRVVKPDGCILYSTCALSPLENDGVIDKLHRRRGGDFELLDIKIPFGKKTDFGLQVRPDTDDGRGPLYISRIHRLA